MSPNTLQGAGSAPKSSRTDDFESPDFYQIDDLLTEEHKLIRSSMRDFVKREISPFIEDWCQRAYFPKDIVAKFGSMGAFGPTIPEQYGGGGLDYISYGLIMQEIERGDSGMRSTASVQGSLVMYPIWKFGSEEQKQKYLPDIASGKLRLQSFGVTEPTTGTDTTSLKTTATKDGDKYIINGQKVWISRVQHSDLMVLLARTKPIEERSSKTDGLSTFCLLYTSDAADD